MSDLERLLALATPGPWRVEGSEYAGFAVRVWGSDRHVAGDHRLERFDAELIAALRNHVPALLAEVRELRLVVAGLLDP